MTTHTIEPAADTIHRAFSRDREPIVWVESGDTIVVRTLDAGGHLEPWLDITAVSNRLNPDSWGHALCGPIGVRGAKPGQTLEVELQQIRPGSWGWTGVAGSAMAFNEKVGVGGEFVHALGWQLDPDEGVAVDQHGHRVRLRPFMGVMGMPPDEDGEHPTAPPRWCGGNLDCKELVVGSRLLLPISVEGALFSIGDGHARQGDGEVSGMAIECPMERVEFVLRVLDEPVLSMPRAHTPAGWVTFGLSDDLDDAVAQATSQMLDLMCDSMAIDRAQALALASLVVDVRVTQMVNGVIGAHAVLADDAIG